uniref:Beta-keto acid cleavage enzyme n=1 Tax=Siphoviridae sp. ctKRD15 TaxID=2825441 RepID=A0A8S5V5I8_9CAUD|nr:MAG TPA: beta-keto acid cleavage enzyme [Siphoviridae sp. ctKRD15]
MSELKNKTIITVATTGAWPTKANNPKNHTFQHLPTPPGVSPEARARRPGPPTGPPAPPPEPHFSASPDSSGCQP